MRAISLWQPYASLIAWDSKEYETRSWATTYRGPIAIHAAKTRETTDELAETFHDFREAKQAIPEHWSFEFYFLKVVRDRFDHFRLGDLPFGAVVCVVDLVDCIPMTSNFINAQSDQERAFGHWQPGRFAWKMKVIERFSQAIPAKGMQGIWNWQCEVAPSGGSERE